MLVLLPPSEGKAPGGGRPLDLAGLSFPDLTPIRQHLVSRLQELAIHQPEQLRLALGLSPRQSTEVAVDAELTRSGTVPALARYSGVLYDALGYRDLAGAGRRRADRSLVVASALFGLLRPRDLVPAYRLSAGTVVPGIEPLARLWRPAVEAELARSPGLVVDLRSGAYAALGRVEGAVDVRVLRRCGGRTTVVSHDNKWTKGRLARALCDHGARTPQEVAELGRALCDDVQLQGRRVDLVLTGLARDRPGAAASAQTWAG